MEIQGGQRNFARTILLAAGALTVVMSSFFGTLRLIDYFNPDYNDPRVRDQLRAQHAARLKKALSDYRYDNRSYPKLPDNGVDDLKKFLVDGGYLKEIPNDPMKASTGKQYRYTSNGTNVYGLLFQLETASGKIPAQGLCLTGVGVAGTGAWGQPPDCPF